MCQIIQQLDNRRFIHELLTIVLKELSCKPWKKHTANQRKKMISTNTLTKHRLGYVQTDATLLANNSQHGLMLHVVSVCTLWRMLLDAVACCCAKFESGQTFQATTLNISFVLWSPKHSTTMLDLFAQLFQHCWGHARSLRMVSKVLWVVSFPGYTAGPNIVGSCCTHLHSTANTHTTTPNIVGATMLGVVASVCTQP